jgi:hypothetical protein
VAQAEALGVEYRLTAGEGVFRRGTAWSLVWDCPRCERRVRLAASWSHTEPCSEACVCLGWSGPCECGAALVIALWPDVDL